MAEVCGVAHPEIAVATCISPSDRTTHVQHFWKPPAFGAEALYWPNEDYVPQFRHPLKTEVRREVRKMAARTRSPRARVSDPVSAHIAADQIEPAAGLCKANVLAYLQDRRGQWVDGNELETPLTGGDQGLKRLRELRADGHNIENRPHPRGRGTWQYRLV